LVAETDSAGSASLNKNGLSGGNDMQRRTFRPQEAALGAGLALLAFCIIGLTIQITVGFSYDNVGPRTFPYLIAALLLISGGAILIGAFAATGSAPRWDNDPVRWLPIVLISATLIFQLLVIRKIGWIPAATVAFAVVAYAFGERRILLSLLFGFLLASGTFVLFNYGLQLRLPVGNFLEALL
jgi:putative tricarboxylic transport membrane protein